MHNKALRTFEDIKYWEFKAAGLVGAALGFNPDLDLGINVTTL